MPAASVAREALVANVHELLSEQPIGSNAWKLGRALTQAIADSFTPAIPSVNVDAFALILLNNASRLTELIAAGAIEHMIPTPTIGALGPVVLPGGVTTRNANQYVGAGQIDYLAFDVSPRVPLVLWILQSSVGVFEAAYFKSTLDFGDTLLANVSGAETTQIDACSFVGGQVIFNPGGANNVLVQPGKDYAFKLWS